MTTERPPTPENPIAPGQERELVLSQERLAVSTVPVVRRRVRLEKYVVTETRTVTVQVRREEVRLVEVDPAGDPAGQSATADRPAPGSDRWLILSEERPVVTLQVVPVERVRLSVISMTEDQDVTENVHREDITIDSGTGTTPTAEPPSGTTKKD